MTNAQNVRYRKRDSGMIRLRGHRRRAGTLAGADSFCIIRRDAEGSGEMPDDTNQQGQDGKYNPETVDDAKKIIAALEKRLGERDATIEQLKSGHATLGQQIEAIQEANRQKLLEQGNFNEVRTQLMAQIESLKPAAERAAGLEQIIRDSNEAVIRTVPEAYRAMIPADYPPEKLQTWLHTNLPLLSKQPPPNFDAGAGAGAGGSPAASSLTPEQKAMAKKFGLKDEEVLAEIKRREEKQQEK